MIQWLNLKTERRIQILTQAAARTGIRPHALEKDWWVTLTLKAVFDTEWAPHLVFKGGTSLSKSWGLIERFSEDIDLAVDKEFLGFEGAPNKSKIERLRRSASYFISSEFKEGLIQSLLALGLKEDQFKVLAKYAEDSIRDPQVLELQYDSVLEPDPNPYLKEQVLIEVGARSLREPSSPRSVNSIISDAFPGASFATTSFDVQSVEPQRTFLEKAFLLHELFQRAEGEGTHDRMSRHMYDLERLMDTDHAAKALADKDLYQSIIIHRQQFNKVTGINYELHQHSTIDFVPGEASMRHWENDYRAMQEVMIYGESLSFAHLIDRLKELIGRFRNA
ncbi:nucleotidyl transferase AbiEii/AbiGii toxin family protein [Paracnuella aquatica]|uniref:nucleotidyl transferase AbiEii/AbiGii toxin family protein n=1 Tax=Paracnuella aquatica TaxID=2268757 RepID=UPI000DEEFF3E|nr:nucleotidyl transferase AbiEii/AbiGii toxin family protein [Paracnuella aquatica]RPD47263.1 nucleotidyl transferase AbiEii/AbiGii toxin family protein [Paracnuella aquatica]